MNRYAVHTQADNERRAAMELARQGFTAFLPRYRKCRRHARKIGTAATPLFPRYLFAGFDEINDRWQAINGTTGVHRLVMIGDRPAQVRAGVVEGLMVRADDESVIGIMQQPLSIEGDAVRILGSSFDQCLGPVAGMSDARRVTILMDLLGRKVRVDAGAYVVERAA